MSIRDDQRERTITRLSAHLLDTGLAQTSLRQLAAAAGVSDRMLLYYFADKEEVLAEALGRIAAELMAKLSEAMPDGEALPPRELILRTASHTIQPDMRRYMRLWIELIAAAAKGEEPFVTITAQIMQGFVAWIDARLALPAGADRTAIAAAAIAVLDGLAVLDVSTPGDTIQRTVAAIGQLLAE